MQNVDAKKMIAKGLELLDLYPVLHRTTHAENEEDNFNYPHLSVYTGHTPVTEGRRIRDPEPIDNIYIIEKNTKNKFKYKVIREISKSYKPDYINTANEFFKLIKDSPITIISLDLAPGDRYDSNITLFRCEQANCPEIQNWARSAIRKAIIKSPEYNRYATSVSTMHKRGEFYKNPMTGEPISKADRIDVDNRFLNARNLGTIKTNYFKLKSRTRELRKEQVPKIVQILNRLEKPSDNLDVLNDSYTQVLHVRDSIIQLINAEVADSERQFIQPDQALLSELAQLEQRTLRSLEIIMGQIEGLNAQEVAQIEEENLEDIGQFLDFGKSRTIDRDIKYLSGL